MAIRFTSVVTLAGGLAIAGSASAQWVSFNNETSLRLPAGLNDPSLTTQDDEEKDYAWDDFDQDGDIDLVVVRKTPFTSTGKRVNVLLMNEGVAEGHAINGVLVDRTVEWASDSDVAGDNGFLTATNDRDVVATDVNNDGWVDLVTAPTLTDNQAKNLSHPRVYINLGESGGVWQGFRYEDARIPQMHPNAGPRFCSVAAGDMTGDGSVDLYFGDYDSGGAQIFDYNNKLLINDGNGFFTDQSDSRLSSEMRLSAFGAASVIADMNNDGVLDVVKQTSLNAPTHVAITYNDPTSEGFFNRYDVINSAAPYFVSAGDLNNDGDLDLVITDDGTDTYMISNGPNGQGVVSFTTAQLPNVTSAFGGNSIIRDLNGDGWQDVIITDVDVDIPGCGRETWIFRNQGGTLVLDGEVLPANMRRGVHDMAVFDLNGDGFLDIVSGRCETTEIWINNPPIGANISVISELPEVLEPNTPVELRIRVTPFGGSIVEDSVKLFTSVNGGAFGETTMVEVANSQFAADLPGVSCLETVDFYVGATVGTFDVTFPAAAPADTFTAIAATGTESRFADSMEGDTSEWIVTSILTSSGEWEPATPNGTVNNGDIAAPFDDATEDGTVAFVTQNGVAGGAAGADDLDGGPTYLMSPSFDGLGTTSVSYSAWFYNDDEDDTLRVEITNDNGVSWVDVPSVATGGTNESWQRFSFRVADVITPTDNMRVRFVASDNPNNSVTEAGIDDFSIDTLTCGTPCATDLDGNGDTDFGDVLAVLSAWGPCTDCAADFNQSGAVDFGDLLTILSAYGPCP
ncbi:MAG: FG-GAP-like repeat-containing protein [Phycisphaerales bacterium]